MSKPDQIIPSKVIGFAIPSSIYNLTSDKAMLYNLSIGYSKDPLNKSDLSYTYELSDNFKIAPTLATTKLEIDTMFEALITCPGIPDFNPMLLLHGEESLTLHRALIVDKKYYVNGSIVDVQDKIKGALVVFKMFTYEDEKCAVLAHEMIMTTFIRGIGGFVKGKGTYRKWVRIPRVPRSQPGFRAVQETSKNQALIYRLNGDKNPLHVDPSMAAMGGFKAPILHGLCTYGISCKILLEQFGQGDPELFRNLSGRFTSHVFPGETLVVEAWKIGLNEFAFTTKTLERKKVVLIGSFEVRGKMNVKL